MRAGLLSSPKIVSLLQDKFVCSWSLPPTLEALAKNSDSAQTRVVAKELIDGFRPLVELCIISPEGEILHRVAANEDILNPFPTEEERAAFFLDILTKSVN